MSDWLFSYQTTGRCLSLTSGGKADKVMTEFEKLLEDKKHFGIPIEEVVKEARKKTEEK